MLGGLFGAGLLGMMLGGGFFHFHGGFGFLGLLIQLFLLFMLARWVMNRFMGAPAMAGPGGFARSWFPPLRVNGGGFGPAMGFGGGMASQRGQPISLTSGDYQMFSQLLLGIQAAWSANDLNGLRAMTTPEMLSYFAEQLAELTSRGQHNQVSDVRLQQGDLSEAWQEGRVQYATVSMRFSMIDVTYDRARRIVDGSPTERVTVTEFWTFMRSEGGHWILSAIQQAK
jgi:predicted lipid-binding transport protein (Tim44 family)